ALLATLAPDEFQSTLQLSVSFLRPVRPGRLTGRGHVVHRAGDLVFLEASLADADGLVIATATAPAPVIALASPPAPAGPPSPARRPRCDRGRPAHGPRHDRRRPAASDAVSAPITIRCSSITFASMCRLPWRLVRWGDIM